MRRIGLVIALAFVAVSGAAVEAESARNPCFVAGEAIASCRGTVARAAAALESLRGSAPGAPTREEANEADDDAGDRDAPIALIPSATLPPRARVIDTLQACLPTIAERDIEANPLCRGRPHGLHLSRIRPPDFRFPPLFLAAGTRHSPSLRARRPAERFDGLLFRLPANRAGTDPFPRDSPTLLVPAHPRL